MPQSRLALKFAYHILLVRLKTVLVLQCCSRTVERLSRRMRLLHEWNAISVPLHGPRRRTTSSAPPYFHHRKSERNVGRRRSVCSGSGNPWLRGMTCCLASNRRIVTNTELVCTGRAGKLFGRSEERRVGKECRS